MKAEISNSPHYFLKRFSRLFLYQKAHYLHHVGSSDQFGPEIEVLPGRLLQVQDQGVVGVAQVALKKKSRRGHMLVGAHVA